MVIAVGLNGENGIFLFEGDENEAESLQLKTQ